MYSLPAGHRFWFLGITPTYTGVWLCAGVCPELTTNASAKSRLSTPHLRADRVRAKEKVSGFFIGIDFLFLSDATGFWVASVPAPNADWVEPGIAWAKPSPLSAPLAKTTSPGRPE